MNKHDHITESDLKEIIRNRRNASVGFGIAWLIVFGVLAALLHAYKAKPGVVHGVIIFALLVFILIFGLYFVVNYYFYNHLSVKYRPWNKVLYLYATRLFIGVEVVEAVVDVAEIASPRAGGSSRLDHGVNAGLSLGAAGVAKSNMKTAQSVESYFNQHS